MFPDLRFLLYERSHERPQPAAKPGTRGHIAASAGASKNGSREGADPLGEERLSLGHSGRLALSGSGAPNYVEQLALAKQLAAQDPRQVAKVVKSWVSGNP